MYLGPKSRFGANLDEFRGSGDSLTGPGATWGRAGESLCVSLTLVEDNGSGWLVLMVPIVPEFFGETWSVIVECTGIFLFSLLKDRFGNVDRLLDMGSAGRY